jgi:dolichyl-phosphate-mannose--protein O-mannosyl transferase
MSTWKDWPLLGRPIWYAFDTDPVDKTVRGVLLLGNPLMMWGGVLALFACAWKWITERDRTAFLILFFYLALFGSWIVIPRKIAFYYYYYPAGMILSLAIAYVVKVATQKQLESRVWVMGIVTIAVASVFVFFFPILAALQIPSGAFMRWMLQTPWTRWI